MQNAKSKMPPPPADRGVVSAGPRAAVRPAGFAFSFLIPDF
jgi:hypothetical protein